MSYLAKVAKHGTRMYDKGCMVYQTGLATVMTEVVPLCCLPTYTKTEFSSIEKDIIKLFSWSLWSKDITHLLSPDRYFLYIIPHPYPNLIFDIKMDNIISSPRDWWFN